MFLHLLFFTYYYFIFCLWAQNPNSFLTQMQTHVQFQKKAQAYQACPPLDSRACRPAMHTQSPWPVCLSPRRRPGRYPRTVSACPEHHTNSTDDAQHYMVLTKSRNGWLVNPSAISSHTEHATCMASHSCTLLWFHAASSLGSRFSADLPRNARKRRIAPHLLAH